MRNRKVLRILRWFKYLILTPNIPCKQFLKLAFEKHEQKNGNCQKMTWCFQTLTGNRNRILRGG